MPKGVSRRRTRAQAQVRRTWTPQSSPRQARPAATPHEGEKQIVTKKELPVYLVLGGLPR
jgi:hypothetical protein